MDLKERGQHKAKEIAIQGEKTVAELLDELNLSSASVILSLNGEVVWPDERGSLRLREGDKLLIIPLLAGG